MEILKLTYSGTHNDDPDLWQSTDGQKEKVLRAAEEYGMAREVLLRELAHKTPYRNELSIPSIVKGLRDVLKCSQFTAEETYVPGKGMPVALTLTFHR